jgi:hypothetical protein
MSTRYPQGGSRSAASTPVEEIAAAWVRRIRHPGAAPLRTARDGGCGAVGGAALTRVSTDGRPVGRPALQDLYAAAMSAGRAGYYFAIGGFTDAAQEWADAAHLPLLRFDVDGTPVPLNAAARVGLPDLAD